MVGLIVMSFYYLMVNLMYKINVVKYEEINRNALFFNTHLEQSDCHWTIFINTDVIINIENDTVNQIIDGMREYNEIFTCFPLSIKFNKLINGVKNPVIKIIDNNKKVHEYYENFCEDFMIFKNINKSLNETYEYCYILEYMLKHNKNTQFYRFKPELLSNIQFKEYNKIINYNKFNLELKKTYEKYKRKDDLLNLTNLHSGEI